MPESVCSVGVAERTSWRVFAETTAGYRMQSFCPVQCVSKKVVVFPELDLLEQLGVISWK